MFLAERAYAALALGSFDLCGGADHGPLAPFRGPLLLRGGSSSPCDGRRNSIEADHCQPVSCSCCRSASSRYRADDTMGVASTRFARLRPWWGSSIRDDHEVMFKHQQSQAPRFGVHLPGPARPWNSRYMLPMAITAAAVAVLLLDISAGFGWALLLLGVSYFALILERPARKDHVGRPGNRCRSR